MYPVNQVILNSDPMQGMTDVNQQLQLLEQYKAKMIELQQMTNKHSLWGQIDEEVNALNDFQRAKLLENKDYLENYNNIQALVQKEILNLVKPKIETSNDGKVLLQKQLELVKTLKKDIIAETNIEMDLFNKFREFSKTNPNITYDEFIKTKLG